MFENLRSATAMSGDEKRRQVTYNIHSELFVRRSRIAIGSLQCIRFVWRSTITLFVLSRWN